MMKTLCVSAVGMISLALLVLCTTSAGAGELGSILCGGEKMVRGDTMTAANGSYQLVFQPSDGNLVLYKTIDGSSPWASATNIAPQIGQEVVMQFDGNLVIKGSTCNKCGPQCCYTAGTGITLVRDDIFCNPYLEVSEAGYVAIFHVPPRWKNGIIGP